MTNDEIKRVVQERVRTLANEVIIANDNIEWLGRCLSYLEPRKYCIISYHNTFQMRLSHDTIEEIVALLPEKELLYRFDDIMEDLAKDRSMCATVIKVLESIKSEKENEEEERIKKRIALEEEERNKYRRHY